MKPFEPFDPQQFPENTYSLNRLPVCLLDLDDEVIGSILEFDNWEILRLLVVGHDPVSRDSIHVFANPIKMKGNYILYKKIDLLSHESDFKMVEEKFFPFFISFFLRDKTEKYFPKSAEIKKAYQDVVNIMGKVYQNNTSMVRDYGSGTVLVPGDKNELEANIGSKVELMDIPKLCLKRDDGDYIKACIRYHGGIGAFNYRPLDELTKVQNAEIIECRYDVDPTPRPQWVPVKRAE